ncbi:Tripartite DNA replication factor [Linnemannia exigua]|uniref:DNA replication ATP-dependent helicase/nuclease DNA2 n=1 Tax=Linnemannia exigua TaxID=604196 RepID=A0AAD4D6V7_9FUNG|nr:Tripartite DNA replication factor [Linnemannia exigua]
MPNVPKRKANGPVGGAASSGQGVSKKTGSIKPTTSACDTRLSQASRLHQHSLLPFAMYLHNSSLSSFFGKARTQESASKDSPTTGPSSTFASSTVSAAPPKAPVSLKAPALKPQRRIIIYSDEEDEVPDAKVKPVRPSVPLKTIVASKSKNNVSLVKLPVRQAVPFEKRMPISLPSSPEPAPIEQTEPVKSELAKHEQGVEGGPAKRGSVENVPVKSTPERPKNTRGVPQPPQGLPAPALGQTTPQKRAIITTTPPRPEPKGSPFRTPTGKPRQSISTIESLGLSPQDSVFWAKTPPSEALKKLELMNTGRSHEEEIASIVGRLYETSSAGTALRSMPRGPKDRIKDMLNTIRGSTPHSDLEPEEDMERPDPASPTKDLVERHRLQSQKGFTRHHSAHELGGSVRRRGRTARPLSTLGTTNSPVWPTSPTQTRNDVLKMIEQINANMTGKADSMRTPPRRNPFANDSSSSRLTPGRSERPSAADSIARTPIRDRMSQTQPSPGDFDKFFTDFDMDDKDFEELTQLEHSSAFISTACADSATSSFSSSSSETMVNKTASTFPQDFVGMESGVDNKKGSGHVGTGDRCDTAATVVANMEDAFDDFGDLDDLGDDVFELDGEDEPEPYIEKAKYKRYIIQEVQDDVMDSRWPGSCKVLMALEHQVGVPVKIFLRDSWRPTRVSSGDAVHVIAALVYPKATQELMLEDKQGLLIVKPDYLVPTTALAESFSCIRKPVIDTRARKPDESTIPLVHGTILHELFQQSLRNNDFSTEGMQARIEDLIQAHLNDLCLVNESLETAREAFCQWISSCQAWARRYLRPTPSNEGTMEEMVMTGRGETNLVCINKLLDVEENVWSPMFGLKGKIDASVQVVLKTVDNRNPDSGASMQTLVVPFELKTGKKSNVLSHRAQTTLYTLLMRDRYDVDVQWGLLLYLKTGDFIRVPAPRDEIRTMLMQRNDMAIHEHAKLTLPPMLQRKQQCGRCFSLSSCTVLHKLLEDGTTASAGMETLFDEITDHLNETHATFLKKWDRLLSLEQGDVTKFQSQIWSMLSADRQAIGNCFSNLTLIENRPKVADIQNNQAVVSERFAKHQYRFKIGTPFPSVSQQSLSQTLRVGNSLLSSNISVGDPVVLSSEGQHYALAIGQVLDLSLSEVAVGLDRPLLGPPMKLDKYDVERNQSYRGLIEFDGSALSSSLSAPDASEEFHGMLSKNKITFRIDKDEMAAGLNRARSNLVQLFRADKDGGDAKRRHLVVDLEAPKFMPVDDYHCYNLSLNDNQKSAIDTVLSATDYALILGMPGTGKTTTIAEIIHELVKRGKSVLLTSYTHSAVDNVLLKLAPEMKTVRLGNKDKVHRDIQKLVPDFSQPPLNTVQGIHFFYEQCQVVGTTCLGIGDPLFTEKRFDYCIVDEASQITLPACIGPIRYADVFVLVGDHNQLPPLVKNAEAKKDGFDLSLFKMLSDAHPKAVVSLTYQYRMNKDVMLLSNTLVYDNKLQCANEQVANKALEIPDMGKFRRHCHSETLQDQKELQQQHYEPSSPLTHPQCPGHSKDTPCWLEQALDPQRSVIFIDTDLVPAHEVQVGNSTQNPTEALFIQQLTEALISGGIAEDDIGIISVLRAQLKILSRLMKSRPLLDIHTVDRYQGKDKECVIVSLVRSNAEQHVGELLKDWRRINVAFTRAKRKLVVFGSRHTLQGSPIFSQFLELMERQNWIMTLAPMTQYQHAHLLHRNPLPHPQSQIPVITSPKGKSRRGQQYLLEDVVEDKENLDISTSAVGAVGADGSVPALPQPLPPSSPQRKVFRAKASVTLKGLPVTQNILDSL